MWNVSDISPAALLTALASSVYEYDVSPDGKRFLFVKANTENGPTGEEVAVLERKAAKYPTAPFRYYFSLYRTYRDLAGEIAAQLCGSCTTAHEIGTRKIFLLTFARVYEYLSVRSTESVIWSRATPFSKSLASTS